MRRLAVIALGALIGLGAVVLLGVNLYVQSQGAQGKIQQELTRSLGVPLKIRSMSVTPWGGLELSGITIPQTVSVGPKAFPGGKNIPAARSFPFALFAAAGDQGSFAGCSQGYVAAEHRRKMAPA